MTPLTSHSQNWWLPWQFEVNHSLPKYLPYGVANKKNNHIITAKAFFFSRKFSIHTSSMLRCRNWLMGCGSAVAPTPGKLPSRWEKMVCHTQMASSVESTSPQENNITTCCWMVKSKNPSNKQEYYKIFRDMSKYLRRLVSGGFGSWLDVSLEEGLLMTI